jgi:hypothetical protein
MKDTEMGRAYRTHRKDEKLNILVGKPERKETPWRHKHKWEYNKLIKFISRSRKS